jgi:hypothetical protein
MEKARKEARPKAGSHAQRLEALAEANRIRTERARVEAALRAGEARAASLLLNPPAPADGERRRSAPGGAGDWRGKATSAAQELGPRARPQARASRSASARSWWGTRIPRAARSVPPGWELTGQATKRDRGLRSLPASRVAFAREARWRCLRDPLPARLLAGLRDPSRSLGEPS